MEIACRRCKWDQGRAEGTSRAARVLESSKYIFCVAHYSLDRLWVKYQGIRETAPTKEIQQRSGIQAELHGG